MVACSLKIHHCSASLFRLLESLLFGSHEELLCVLSNTTDDDALMMTSSLGRRLATAKCGCCPYGFHIDLDFVNFVENVSCGHFQPRKTVNLAYSSMNWKVKVDWWFCNIFHITKSRDADGNWKNICLKKNATVWESWVRFVSGKLYFRWFWFPLEWHDNATSVINISYETLDSFSEVFSKITD